jgi:hypothetical protein
MVFSTFQRLCKSRTGALVRKVGLEKAQKKAREDATQFVEDNLSKAKSLIQESKDADTRSIMGVVQKNGFIERSFEAFGNAMHPIMDNGSPAHRPFQIYDNARYGDNVLTYRIGEWCVDMIMHSEGEARNPTSDEMNQMVDEMRLRFYETYGEEAYNQAVPEEQRQLTMERLTKRGITGMLYKPKN